MIDLAREIKETDLKKTYLFSCGQAGFLIKSQSGALVGVDLYLSDCVERVERHTGFKRLLPKIVNPMDLSPEAIICTHPHLDHFDIDSIPLIMSNNKTELFCSKNCDSLVKELKMEEYYSKKIHYVKPGNHFQVSDFKIDFMKCDHGPSAPDAVSVMITVDGKNIFFTGDTCLRLDWVNEFKKKKIDVLIAPINGAFGNLNEEECALLAENLNPGITIPSHYGMFASHHGDVGKFYEIMSQMKLPFYLMRQGEGVEI